MSNDSKSGETQGSIAENTKTYFLKDKQVKMMFKDGAKLLRRSQWHITLTTAKKESEL